MTHDIHDPSKMIFVFGSNLSGIHGAGAALYARKHRGAILGIGEGMAGQSYALPTKGIRISYMSLDTIQEHVQKFMKFAYDTRNENQFQVTRVGTGLSGFRDEDIADMFYFVAHRKSNCFFDTAWSRFLPDDTKFWGTG